MQSERCSAGGDVPTACALFYLQDPSVSGRDPEGNWERAASNAGRGYRPAHDRDLNLVRQGGWSVLLRSVVIQIDFADVMSSSSSRNNLGVMRSVWRLGQVRRWSRRGEGRAGEKLDGELGGKTFASARRGNVRG
jgi:hypothetical protein